MPSYTVHRLLDSYFRHPVLNLIPVLLFGFIGLAYVAKQEPAYRADGVVMVEDQTYLASLTGVRGAEGAGWPTPAAQASRQLNSLLHTDAFLSTVVEQSGLVDPSTLSPGDLQEIRNAIGSHESGENLVTVWSAHAQPEVAHRLAGATIEGFIRWQIDAEVAQSSAAEEFLGPRTEQYREELAAAQRELEDYLQANPAPLRGERPATQQLVVDRLTAAVSSAQARFADALAKEESAQLATAQVESDVRNRLKLVDEPVVPTAPEGSLKTAIMPVAAALAIGALLSLAAIVAGAAADQTVRFPQDLRRLNGLEVLAVLPDTSRWDAPVELEQVNP